MTMAEAALDYAARGLAVFPLAARSKKPMQGSHGALDAVSEAAQVWEWFDENPTANVGISAGKSRLVILDIDPRHGGDESYRDIEARHGALPETPRALTPSGGWHVYLQAPDGVTLRQVNTKDGDEPVLGSGIDTRTRDGGYAVAPPSRTRDGGYAWEAGLSPADVPFATCPEWLIELLRDDRTNGHRERVDVAAILAGVPEGERDNELFRLASKLRRADVPQDVAERIVCDAAAACSPPFPEREAVAKVASAYRYSPEPVAIVASVNPHYVPVRTNEESEERCLPEYPVGVLPDFLRSFVSEASAAVGVPPEMVALPLLANAAATIGNRVELVVKPNFRQRAILWCAVVAAPGAAKTPAAMTANEPVMALQREAMALWTDDWGRYEADLAAWDGEPKTERGPRPEPPTLEHFLTTDSTVEALVNMAGTSPGIALQRDELVGWVQSMDAYRKGGGRQHFLSAWSGASLKVDRRTSKPLFVEHPVVCVSGGIQPELLGALADEAGRRDGFLERFLWATPAVKPARWTEDEVSPATLARVTELFRALRYADVGDGVVKLAPAAKTIWADWYNANGITTMEGSGLLAGVSAKLPVQVARLALVIHCIADPENVARPLDVATMSAAIALAEYHRGHAEHVLSPLNANPAGGPQAMPGRILRAIDAAGPDGLTATDLHRALGGHTPADRLRSILGTLEDRGDIEVTIEHTGGRPRETWRRPVRTNEESELSHPRIVAMTTEDLSSDSSFVRVHVPANGRHA